jgi:putative membrane protein
MDKKEQNLANDQMANERTFLAWIRTGIGIMVFGFVIVKFSLFVNQLPSRLFQEPDLPKNGSTIFLGIGLVLTGAVTILLSYFRYKRTNELLQEGKYLHSTVLLTFLTVVIIAMSILIIAYLILSAYPLQ